MAGNGLLRGVTQYSHNCTASSTEFTMLINYQRNGSWSLPPLSCDTVHCRQKRQRVEHSLIIIRSDYNNYWMTITEAEGLQKLNLIDYSLVHSDRPTTNKPKKYKFAATRPDEPENNYSDLKITAKLTCPSNTCENTIRRNEKQSLSENVSGTASATS